MESEKVTISQELEQNDEILLNCLEKLDSEIFEENNDCASKKTSYSPINSTSILLESEDEISECESNDDEESKLVSLYRLLFYIHFSYFNFNRPTGCCGKRLLLPDSCTEIYHEIEYLPQKNTTEKRVKYIHLYNDISTQWNATLENIHFDWSGENEKNIPEHRITRKHQSEFKFTTNGVRHIRFDADTEPTIGVSIDTVLNGIRKNFERMRPRLIHDVIDIHNTNYSSLVSGINRLATKREFVHVFYHGPRQSLREFKSENPTVATKHLICDRIDHTKHSLSNNLNTMLRVYKSIEKESEQETKQATQKMKKRRHSTTSSESEQESKQTKKKMLSKKMKSSAEEKNTGEDTSTSSTTVRGTRTRADAINGIFDHAKKLSRPKQTSTKQSDISDPCSSIQSKD